MTPADGEPRRLRTILPDLWALVAPRRRAVALGALLVLANRAAAIFPPIATKLLINDVLGERKVELLPRLALFIAAAALVQAASGYALAQVSTMWTARLVAELRRKLHAHVMRLPLAFHDGNKSGTVASRIMSDVLGLQSLLGSGLVSLASSLATAALAFGVMAWFSPTLAAVVLAGVAAFGTLAALPTRRTKSIAQRRNEILADVLGRLHEALGGVRVIKAYRAEAREDAIFAAGVTRLVENTAKNLRVSSSMNLVTTAIWGLVGALVTYVGARLILARELTLGGFFTFGMLLAFMVAPTLQVAAFGTTLMDAVAGLEHMRTILGLQPEAADPRRRTTIGPIRGEVSFEHVDFGYEAGRSVLNDVCFRAAPGTVTALVGPSGAGKSTILGLIASFHVPSAGTIRVDDTDLADVRLDAYREQLGVVLQDNFLFDGTVRENIAFASPARPRGGRRRPRRPLRRVRRGVSRTATTRSSASAA